MGKSCIRFKRTEDLPMNVIGDAVAVTSATPGSAHPAVRTEARALAATGTGATGSFG